RGPVSTDAQYGYCARVIAPDARLEALAPGNELPGRELVGGSGSASDEVGDPVAGLQQLALLRRIEQAPRKARPVERRPEAVAGTREVMTGRAGVEPGIDAAEEDPESRRDCVRDGLPGCREQLRAGGLVRACHEDGRYGRTTPRSRRYSATSRPLSC